MLEKTESAIENGKSRSIGNNGHKTHNEDKQSKNTTQKSICSLTTKYERSRLRTTHHQCLENYQLTIYNNEIVICDMNYYLLCPIRGNPCLTFQNYFFFLLFTKSNVIQEATSHSGAHEFTPGFYGSRDVYYLVLFRFTTFDYLFP